MPSYVLVDKGQMAVTHKHHSRETLARLAWIECMNAATSIPLGNPKHWADAFTPQELKQIYEAGTGVKLNAYGTGLAVACHDMAVRMPTTVVNEDEVQAQYLKVADGDKAAFQYQPGSMEPKKYPPKGFTPDPLRVERSEAEEKRAAYQPNLASTTVAGTASTSAASAPERASPFSVPVPQPKEPGQPRSGGVREIVFKVADDLWEKAGKPTDPKVILTLRKTMMDVLETEHSVKRTTGSTTLGAWQKERIS